MDYLVVIFAIVSAWAVLRVIGAERERRVREIAVRIALLPPPPPPPVPEKPPTPLPPLVPAVRSKAGR